VASKREVEKERREKNRVSWRGDIPNSKRNIAKEIGG